MFSLFKKNAINAKNPTGYQRLEPNTDSARKTTTADRHNCHYPNMRTHPGQPSSRLLDVLTDTTTPTPPPEIPHTEEPVVFSKEQAAQLKSLSAQHDAIQRACTLVIDIPDELQNQPPELIEYYRVFNSAFDQLYTSARVAGSGLFSMESRAAAQDNDGQNVRSTIRTWASHIPNILQKTVNSMPFPMSTVAVVTATVWVYQRDTRVLYSLNAFANLMQPHMLEHHLIGKQLATQICLQRKAELLELASQPKPSSRLSTIATGINKIKQFAAKHHLSQIDYWQSPMALKALEDLSALQKGVLTTSVEQIDRYQALRHDSTANKTDFLLALLELNPANIQRPVGRQSAAVAAVTAGVNAQDLHPRQQANNTEPQFSTAFRHTALAFDDLRAENQALQTQLAEQAKNQAILKANLAQTQDQVLALTQTTARLEQEIGNMRAMKPRKNQHHNPPSLADACCVIM